ncbi:MAG: 5-formyltetrahydrofolate cyclo-ligase [Clostridiaceae bacterium]|nr:5-formyltetrahydrofolate cyclo-ligase [Clostridiaceae bacterium]MBW4860276.1 5-formyltetrahydrofolate cyclo-ligase [Clostridiaceae bacterium]MBW4868934.1 5-formyltetrahydrofolate cyclo-ligase [Clostridiaceae bacterium]
MNKAVLRKQYLEKRSALPISKVEEKSNNIINKLFDLDIYKNSSFIMSYVDFRKEVKTENLIKHSLNIQKRIGIPITIPETRKLIVSELKNYDIELSPGYFNILTPKKEYIREIPPTLIDFVIVPGAIFDKSGYRIGYGGGYYDRFLGTLNERAISIGLAYDFQLLDSVPRSKYDLPVDYILTEKQFISCKTKKF